MRTGVPIPTTPRSTTARFYPHQLEEKFIEGPLLRGGQKIYFPAVHPREPYASGRQRQRSPLLRAPRRTRRYFMELGGWERAHAMPHAPTCSKNTQPHSGFAENECDNRHFWRVFQAEHLAMSEDCGSSPFSHFPHGGYRRAGPCGASRVALRRQDRGDAISARASTPTSSMTRHGARRLHPSFRMTRCRLVNVPMPARVTFHYMRRVRGKTGASTSPSRTFRRSSSTIGIWGPNARETLKKVRGGTGRPSIGRISPSPRIKQIEIAGSRSPLPSPMSASRAGTAHENEDGLAVWDALRATRPSWPSASKPTHSRRDGKSPACQNADLLTHYQSYEADLARPEGSRKRTSAQGEAYGVHSARAPSPPCSARSLMTETPDRNGVSATPSATCRS